MERNGGMAEWRNGGMAEWQNGGMAEWQNGGMTEWRNGRMAEWRNGRLAEWRNGEMAEWRNGRMAECHNVRYEIVQNQDTESTQMPPWQSPSWLVIVLTNFIFESPYKCNTATTAVTLPVLTVSTAFSSALLSLIGICSVTLIGRGLVDLRSDIKGLSNLRHLSTNYSVSRHPASYSESKSLLLGES